ncbi:MAG: TIGR02647 family protein [Pseudomonadota bacterium]
MNTGFSKDIVDELNVILLFPDDSLRQGIKIHHDAELAVQQAAARLYDKGIISQRDGGYLTDSGHELVRHAQIIRSALTHS